MACTVREAWFKVAFTVHDSPFMAEAETYSVDNKSPEANEITRAQRKREAIIA